MKKGKLAEYNTQLADYVIQDHAEKVLAKDLLKSDMHTFYLPMHGVERPHQQQQNCVLSVTH